MEFWDTSALFKLYIPEPDSDWFQAFAISQAGPIFASSITGVEIAAPVIRRILLGTLRPASLAKIRSDYRRDCDSSRIISVPCRQDVIDRAADVASAVARGTRPMMLRSLDAIQVASALEAGAKMMVATDARLREVASRNGLKLIPR